ncbi:MAG TPA: hypothetical protein VIK18_20440, partial [Pirellulales bacterium]
MLPVTDLPASFTIAFGDFAGATTNLDPSLGGSFSGVTADSTITLQAANITVSSALNLNTATGANNVSLVLQAYDSITVLAPITADGTGTIELDAYNTAPIGTGIVTISAPITADAGISISGLSIVLGSDVSAGGPITIDGLGSALNLSGPGSLVGTSNGSTITIENVSTLLLGTVSAAGDTLSLNTSGDITQVSTLNVGNLTGSSGGSILLTDTGNEIATVGTLSSAGNLELQTGEDLTVNGPITDDLDASTVQINVSSAALTLAGDFGTAAGNGITINLSASGITQSSGTVDAGSGTITLNGETGAISLASDLTTDGGDISVSGTGITQSAGTLDSGSGTITLDGSSAAISLAGALTSSNTAAAITIQNATTLSLGVITA